MVNLNNTESVKGNYFPKEKTIKMVRDYLTQECNFLVGRLKTIVDATISEPVQNKAMKDLLSQEVWRFYNSILEETGVSGKIISDGEKRI